MPRFRFLFALLLTAPVGAAEPVRLPLLLDTAGTAHRIGEAPDTKAVVLVFLGPECPLCQRYGPTLKTLFAGRGEGVEFYGVVAGASHSRKDAIGFAKEYELPFPLLFDVTCELAARFKPTHVPEAFVLTPELTVAYRGRIDDWYIALGKPRAAVTSHDLKDALTAVREGKKPVTGKTEPVGCFFEDTIPALGKAPAKVTFNRHVAPLLFANCSHCHRPGEVAPFPLLDYTDAKKRAKQIALVTESKTMPPWKLVPGHGRFADERLLTATEIATLKAWADAGAPEGDKADLPPTPTFATGWHLGKPDLVVKMTEPFTVPANGKDVLRNFVIPMPALKDTQMVGAIEFRPGNRKVVHHALALLDTTGTARKLDARDPAPGYDAENGGFGFFPTGSVGGWAPGVVPRFLPDGVARYLAKGSDMVLQVHYHPSGKEETDQSEVAIYFSRKPVKRIVAGFGVENWHIDMPAGEKDYRLKAEYKLPVDVTLIGTAPHMHLLGREMTATAVLPGGETIPLAKVDDWDFNWQDYYVYRKPIKLPKGTIVKMESRHDNSAGNPANPNSPPKRLKYGEGTADEMSLILFECTCESFGDLLLLVADTVRHNQVVERFGPKRK